MESIVREFSDIYFERKFNISGKIIEYILVHSIHIWVPTDQTRSNV